MTTYSGSDETLRETSETGWDGNSQWCLIESDPGVFTELVNSIGVRGVQLEELYSLSAEAFLELTARHPATYGIVFLFKWTGSSASQGILVKELPRDLFFAKQVVTNACATQAIVSVLLNVDGIKDIGDELRRLKEFTRDFDCVMKGLTLSNSELLRTMHNAFRGGSTTFELLGSAESVKSDKEAFHFVSYIPFRGGVYELDGLQEGPILIGTFSDDPDPLVTTRRWLEIVRKYICGRVTCIQQESERLHSFEAPVDRVEIRFNVMAVVEDQLQKQEHFLASLRRQRVATCIQLLSFGEDVAFSPDDIADGEDAGDAVQLLTDNNTESLKPEELKMKLQTLETQIHETSAIVRYEKEKRKRWTVENQRRRHDFTPFVLSALIKLAKTGLLQHVYNTIIEEEASNLMKSF